jgi:YegS/Rv2252/BmrU family lipid kinase
MSTKQVQLLVGIFDGTDTAVEKLNHIRSSKSTRHLGIQSAIVLYKDEDGQIQTVDVGLTPRRGAVSGLVLGGVVGVLTGGTTLVLGGIGALIGRHMGRKKQEARLDTPAVHQIGNALVPGASLILMVVQTDKAPTVSTLLEQEGAEVMAVEISEALRKQLSENEEDVYQAVSDKIKLETAVPYPRIFVVINPAAGKDEPILNVLNDVFNTYGIEWDAKVTHKYGDATELARQAAEAGYDLVCGYGGDGTQHEVANGLMGTNAIMGVLPGGTGNGFANELGTPTTLRPAAEMLCTSPNVRAIDIVQMGDQYFIQRLFTGIEPEEQTSREMKDKYGTFAYVMRDAERFRNRKDISYKLTIDGEVIEVEGMKCYIVNSAKAGTGFSIDVNFSVDDGYLDVFMLTSKMESMIAAANRFLQIPSEKASMYLWRGQEITIESEPSQPVWTDGEFTTRTPVTVKGAD